MNIHQNEKNQFLSNQFSPSENISKTQENASANKPQSSPTEQPPKYILHKVQYGDTIEGLSLQYSVPISKIRHINGIEGDSIYHLRILIIPYPQIIPENKQKTQQLLIEQFLAHLAQSEKDKKVAKFYLGQNDWDVQKSLTQYRADLEWERKNNFQYKNKPQSSEESFKSRQIQMKEFKNLLFRMQLRNKKLI